MPKMSGVDLANHLRKNPKLAQVSLIMMTSMGARGDGQKLAALGFKAYFPKPFSMSDLFDAISVVLSGGQVLEQAKPLVTQHYLKNLQKYTQQQVFRKKSANEKFQILLVEDHYVNQKLAKWSIEELGHTCEIAPNGYQAIKTLQQKSADRFDLILMDCQMPVLDGYQTTQKIREGEAGEHWRHAIIIAMTANALQGDKEKCLSSGMNDYISKPIILDTLQQKLS
ncbi:response regulator [Aliikangiella maris]|uniref:Response regulator n=2 Tax=Aliikangiella maris TaxID=3162458 RepID=A0ABV3MQH5_9GAMM